MKRRAGLLLAGCGAFDGSDPHEAVIALLCLQQAGLEVVPIALDTPQFHIVDHTTAQEEGAGVRSMAVEAARLVRGKVWHPQELAPNLLEILVIPGGQGPVKNFFATAEVSEARVLHPELLTLIQGVHRAGGSLGAISLGEFVLSAALGPWPDGKGCFDIVADEILIDQPMRRVLTPGYTLVGNLPELYRGIEKMTRALINLLEVTSP